MVKNINITVYNINELNDKAKDKVLGEWHHCLIDCNWWDDIYDEFNQIMEYLGFDLDENEPCFTGFASQGDGASFTGDWLSGRMTKEIMFYSHINPAFFKCSELRTVADMLEVLANKRLTGEVQRYNLRYLHENTMVCNLIEINEDVPIVTDSLKNIFDTACKQLAKLLYKALEKEYEYLTSDECLIEHLMTNEYEFTEDGKAFP